MDTDALVLRFQKKDILAFERLYEMYCDNICGVINTIVRDKYLAEEITQDVFAKVWAKSDSYNVSKGRFFTWILNISRNAAIDKVRSESHRDHKKNPTANYFISILDDSNIDRPIIDAIGLKKLMKNVKEKCIQLIELLYFKGYSQKEISEELDIPLGTIKTRNRSCISQLRENLTLEWM